MNYLLSITGVTLMHRQVDAAFWAIYRLLVDRTDRQHCTAYWHRQPSYNYQLPSTSFHREMKTELLYITAYHQHARDYFHTVRRGERTLTLVIVCPMLCICIGQNIKSRKRPSVRTRWSHLIWRNFVKKMSENLRGVLFFDSHCTSV